MDVVLSTVFDAFCCGSARTSEFIRHLITGCFRKWLHPFCFYVYCRCIIVNREPSLSLATAATAVVQLDASTAPSSMLDCKACVLCLCHGEGRAHFVDDGRSDAAR